jgi:hypothetical protein
MRLWSIHPKYLDTKGLVALWREGLLAQKVVQGKTKGYRKHPQLIRFLQSENPYEAISFFLLIVFMESEKRGFKFDNNKITGIVNENIKIKVTNKQILYEWELLKSKIYNRDKTRFNEIRKVEFPETHPIFQIINGEIEKWEKIKELNNNFVNE